MVALVHLDCCCCHVCAAAAATAAFDEVAGHAAGAAVLGLLHLVPSLQLHSRQLPPRADNHAVEAVGFRGGRFNLSGGGGYSWHCSACLSSCCLLRLGHCCCAGVPKGPTALWYWYVVGVTALSSRYLLPGRVSMGGTADTASAHSVSDCGPEGIGIDTAPWPPKATGTRARGRLDFVWRCVHNAASLAVLLAWWSGLCG